MTGIEPWPQRWEARVLPLCHRGPCQEVRYRMYFIFKSMKISSILVSSILFNIGLRKAHVTLYVESIVVDAVL